MPIELLINSGKPLEAWEAIQGLPPRLKFTTQAMRQRLRCAMLLGWTRRAAMLEAVIATPLGEGQFGVPTDKLAILPDGKPSLSEAATGERANALPMALASPAA